MNDDFSITWNGKEIPALEDELSEEELEQLDKDARLDGIPGTIPNWSVHYKGDK